MGFLFFEQMAATKETARKNLQKALQKRKAIREKTGKDPSANPQGIRKDWLVHGVRESMLNYPGGYIALLEKIRDEDLRSYVTLLKAIIPKQIEISGDQEKPVQMIVRWLQPDKSGE